MEAAIVVLTLGILTLGYIIYNLLRKVEKYEDVIVKYDVGLQNLAKTLAESTETLKELDVRGHFQVDDELGQFFTAMKKAQQEINDTFLEIEDNA